jgi:hypothetical protein
MPPPFRARRSTFREISRLWTSRQSLEDITETDLADAPVNRLSTPYFLNVLISPPVVNQGFAGWLPGLGK